jgi:hypothetical protein
LCKSCWICLTEILNATVWANTSLPIFHFFSFIGVPRDTFSFFRLNNAWTLTWCEKLSNRDIVVYRFTRVNVPTSLLFFS